MGMIGQFFGIGDVATGIGNAVEGVAEVFTVNKTKAELAANARAMAALGQYGAEFATPRQSRFDAFINGINRLPRPVMALGTVGLFVFAMADPTAFAERMRGLAFVPEPLWWLLGAVVSFYFGARELHYARAGRRTPEGAVPLLRVPVAPETGGAGDAGGAGGVKTGQATPTASPANTPEAPTAEDNPALKEWLAQAGG